MSKVKVKDYAELLFKPIPENCLECQLHILTLEKQAFFNEEYFSCAGYKGRGTLNPECDFLNNFESYSKGKAKNCPLSMKQVFSYG